jgi:hypothetical protein
MNIEIIRDPTFMRGFTLVSEKRSILPSYDDGGGGKPPETLNRFDFGQRVTAPFQNQEPEWFLQQCFMKHQLATDMTLKIGAHSYSLSNVSEKIERKAGGQLSLALYSHKEYKAPRKLNEGWPYLAVSQHYQGEYISKMRSLKLSADISFTSFKDFMGPSFDPTLHTFQVIWYLVIGNLNVKSNGFGDFFFFGLPLIDKPRFVQPEEYCAEDYGNRSASHMFIYHVDSHRFLKEPLEVGGEAAFSLTCLQDVKNTFAMAQGKGYMKNSKLTDLEICQTVLGIETEGTYDGSITINSLSIEKEMV